MKYIGNVCYWEELINHTKVEYINYINLKNSENNLNSIDVNVPTLFVGWYSLKKNYPLFKNGNIEDISILNKEYKKNLRFWEFSFNENKSEHINGVNMFIRNAPYYFFRENYQYINIDPIFNNIINIEDIKKHVPINSDFIYNYKDEMIYILKSNIIYGLNLNMYDFFNINKMKLINTIKVKSKNYINDIDGKKYLDSYKIYPNFDELKRYLVVLLSKL